MRLFKLALLIATISSSVFAQSEDESIASPMMSIVEPEFKGPNENSEIKEFIEQNLDTPLSAQNWGIEGTVVIRFNVLPTQYLLEFQVIHSVSSRLD